MNNSASASIIVGMLFFAGCDDGGAPPDMQERTVSSCAYENFEVELTAGPSAPLKLTGTLFLAASAADEGALRGLFEVGDQQYAVSSSYTEGGNLGLTVAVGDGYVMGLGKVAELCDPDARIEGVAVGPTVSATHTIDGTDSGHWLLSDASLSEMIYYYDHDYDLGDSQTSNVIVKIPITEVCTKNVATKASCYESFCQAQKAGHYSADATSGEPICS